MGVVLAAFSGLLNTALKPRSPQQSNHLFGDARRRGWLMSCVHFSGDRRQ
jgi:uncharacterized caspase-like protein